MSVVVCAYAEDRLDALAAAVTLVLAQVQAGDELLVIIDHNDTLLERAAALLAGPAARQSPGVTVRVLRNKNSPGLSGARNTGVAEATCSLVAFLDDDAEPQPGWLAALVAPFDDPSVIGTGGVALPQWAGDSPRWFPEEFLWVVGCSYRGQPEQTQEIRNPIGANMAFRRETIIRAGGFTDGIGRIGRTPLGCEETEFSIRAANVTGGRILQLPDAVVGHLVPAERARPSYFLRRCWAEGISKAAISRLVGSSAALASERRYTTRTLPRGFLRGIGDAARGEGPTAKPAAIVVGLLVVTAGYIRGRVTKLVEDEPDPASAASPGDEPGTDSFVPLWSGQLELTSPRLPHQLTRRDGQPLESARLLVRAAGTPLGFIEIDAPGGRPELEAAVDLAGATFAGAAEDAITDSAWSRTRGPRVSVVLCTHDRPDGLCQTLKSLQELDYADFEVIVVDNAPSDDRAAVAVADLASGDARISYMQEPVKGLSRARNLAVERAEGEVIAFTDDDVVVDALWLHGLARGFARDERVACVTGLVASSYLEHPAEQYFDRRVWWSSNWEYRLHTGAPDAEGAALYPYAPGTFGTGANFACRRDVLKALGGFDQCLGPGTPTHAGEDLDLFVRIARAGHMISYEPSALVWHRHRVDDASLGAQIHAYGVGLTAYLSKYLLSPRTRGAVARRMLIGARHALTVARRSRDAHAAASLDTDLRAAEIRGMLAGPFAYLRARRGQDARHLRSVAP